MGRKTLADNINDPFLLTLEGRDPATPLTEGQASGFLMVSTSSLSEWRDAGKWPPEWYEDEDYKGVRYPLGGLRQYVNDRVEATRLKRARPTEAPPAPPLEKTSAVEKVKQLAGKDAVQVFGLEDAPLLGGRGGKVVHSSFAQFLSIGAPDDEWVFLMVPSHFADLGVCRPVDLIESLDMDLDTLVGAESEQLSLSVYAETLAAYLLAEQAALREEQASQRQARAGELPPRVDGAPVRGPRSRP